ncbi:molybdopterin-guanine dinucleotide biosynthesis domain-containing protein (plasmid) [Rhizobium etli bv. mimosae str. IE4771]|uniref:Molybdopterin-guanine dinucleotide biosynthesis domain-containing protein n=1 Tax=Rhizobium etli bv. mimosae str. IE4771 TaxID=1432050 RepID=A0A060I736_RHIET|nr:nucleotidyltransferase family protein [Rhizobium sp. IE4771]AIC29554.1 molybdopterin-guanine dinucleotide biosynthesis domain-containing protein [Rhizobium sp. IE4771]
MERIADHSEVAVVLLAAGQARRYGNATDSKLLAVFDGVPLVRQSAMRACKSMAHSVTVIVGFRAPELISALSGLPISILHNPDFASGMSSSLITGMTTPQVRSAEGTLVMLADMPSVSTADINLLIEAFVAHGGRSIIIASCGNVRGNPVILPRSLLSEVARLKGDLGARNIIRASNVPVVEVDIGPSALHDVDTLEALVAAGGIVS